MSGFGSAVSITGAGSGNSPGAAAQAKAAAGSGILLLTASPGRGIAPVLKRSHEGESSVAKPEWGTKRICPNCGARYYDLGKAIGDIACPKCGSQFDPEAFLKVRRTRVPAPAEREVEVATGEEADTDVVLEEGDVAEEEDEEVVAEGAGEEEDEELIEDASELGEDEDDMAEVIENVEDEEER
jgi:uncharacterized protein (TIGR02300 family)